MQVHEAFSLLGLSPSPPPDEGAVRAAFKELALPFLALGEGDAQRHTRLWELCQAYEVRLKGTGGLRARVYVFPLRECRDGLVRRLLLFVLSLPSLAAAEVELAFECVCLEPFQSRCSTAHVCHSQTSRVSKIVQSKPEKSPLLLLNTVTTSQHHHHADPFALLLSFKTLPPLHP